jgi:crotonobetainyl-CoA:carnitine CoA-transferase CaiB-like acyl-CoA transferase
MPKLREHLSDISAQEIAQRMEAAGLPYAPISRPQDLLDDPHLRATGGLADMVLPDGPRAGQTIKGTLLPLTLRGERLGVRLNPPRLGSHTDALLQALGCTPDEVAAWRQAGVVA